MRAGLVSITFRSRPAAEVVRIAADAGLQAIEWGGDIHVPQGDVRRAKEIGRATRESGMEVACYGSYYRLALGADFSMVLKSALALGAPVIRVWAGNRGAAEADATWRQAVVDDARRCVALAADHGIAVGLEFHGGTLTDTLASTVELLNEVAALRSLWQPPVGWPVEENVAAIRALASRLSHVHAFHWGPSGWNDRRALADGESEWAVYIDELHRSGFRGDILLEFVAGDDPVQLRDDAAVLKRLISRET